MNLDPDPLYVPEDEPAPAPPRRSVAIWWFCLAVLILAVVVAVTR